LLDQEKETKRSQDAANPSRLSPFFWKSKWVAKAPTKIILKKRCSPLTGTAQHQGHALLRMKINVMCQCAQSRTRLGGNEMRLGVML